MALWLIFRNILFTCAVRAWQVRVSFMISILAEFTAVALSAQLPPLANWRVSVSIAKERQLAANTAGFSFWGIVGVPMSPM